MTKEQLIVRISKYGHVQICKADYVLTLLITGTGLSKIDNVGAIQKLILEFAGLKYPLIETLRNDDTFYCIVLKPDKEKECEHNWISSAAYKGAKICTICNQYK